MELELFVSLFFTGLTVYNLAVHGTCDPESPDQCLFTPEGSVCDCPEGECIHNENPSLDCTEPNCSCSGEECST